MLFVFQIVLRSFIANVVKLGEITEKDKSGSILLAGDILSNNGYPLVLLHLYAKLSDTEELAFCTNNNLYE